jgi:hypothetical protein
VKDVKMMLYQVNLFVVYMKKLNKEKMAKKFSVKK